MYIKILFSDEIPGGARRHTARAYIFRPYINTRIIMNARARSLAPFSLPLCVYSFAHSRASERASEPGPLDARESLLCTCSFLFRSSHALCAPRDVTPSLCQKKAPRRRRRRLTRQTIADDGRESDDESGTGRLTPVVAGDLPAYLPADLEQRGLSTLSTILARSLNGTLYLAIFFIG